MATKIVINIESLRGVAGNMRTLATQVEGKKDTLYSRGSSLDTVGTDSLSTVADDVQSLKDHATALDARVDLAILHNSGDGKNVPETGNISYTVEGEDSAKPEDVERELGVAIAGLGEDIATSEYQEGDPRVELLRSKMQTWNANTNVMGATFDSWGPEGTLAVTTAVGDHVGYAYRASEEQSEIAQKTLNLLKSGMNTATSGWADSKAEKFGRDMIDVSVTGWSSGSPYDQRFGLYLPREAMAFLTHRNIGASDAFILGAMEQADKYDQEYAEHMGGGSPWDTMNGPSRFLPAMIDEGDAEWAFDVPTNLLHDLSIRPEASFEFFSADDSRSEYWVTKRDYSDDFTAVAAALDAASTDWRVTSSHPEEAAEIAALAINGLGSRDDFGHVEHPLWPDEITGVGAAGSLGHILSTYIEGMNYSIIDNEYTNILNHAEPRDDMYGNELPAMPRFNVDKLSNVLNVVGRDGGAFLELRGAQNRYQDQIIRPGMTEDQFKNAAQDLGKVEGYVAYVIGTGRIDDAKAHDKYMKAWIDLAGKPASELTGLASKFGPGPVGKAAGWGSEALVNHLATQAETTWANETPGTIEDMNQQAHVAQAQFARNLLMSADADGLAGYQNGSAPLSQNNEAAVKNDDGSYRLMTREEYDALTEEAQAPTRGKDESDAEFSERERKADAARERLTKVNNDMTDIAKGERGYMNMITREDVEEAYKNAFLSYFPEEE
ncbi:hypothetical protein [Actinomyces bowdenii]|uniref:Uncharacterized protein n=1 Tax=Actinomyces bowdenii TaxID=131109 RepID=A0A853EFC2_9ACTO|nr:hypothetical protein [Actinomyces bowdenii]MBF0695806.1 hypothetical protein [Actinomyces bowdenii]NYS67979.1 hypothetical protein [Actinomyces bowdenii]